MAHFTSITIGLSVEAEFKKILTVEQFEAHSDLLDKLVSFSMFTHDWKDAPQRDLDHGFHYDEHSDQLAVIDEPARDSLYALIGAIGVAKSRKIAEAMDIATGRNFGAEMFDEVRPLRKFSRPAAA